MSAEPTVDWTALRTAATDVAQRGYAPYSGLHVGAAGLTIEGDIVLGCNVENASFGMTLCAECGLVSDLHRRGSEGLVAVCVVAGNGEVLMPCGRCRQLLFEAGGPTLMLYTDESPIRLDELLPRAFGPRDLPPEASA
ncbi:MAG: cytidine deaminase [Acidimicrobiia bacterium]|nr:cytidine deaminase [Acidimicrobiia bacterium]